MKSFTEKNHIHVKALIKPQSCSSIKQQSSVSENAKVTP